MDYNPTVILYRKETAMLLFALKRNLSDWSVEFGREGGVS